MLTRTLGRYVDQDDPQKLPFADMPQKERVALAELTLASVAHWRAQGLLDAEIAAKLGITVEALQTLETRAIIDHITK